MSLYLKERYSSEYKYESGRELWDRQLGIIDIPFSFKEPFDLFIDYVFADPREKHFVYQIDDFPQKCRTNLKLL